MTNTKNVLNYIDTVAVLFTHGNGNLKTFPFPKCKYLFINKCSNTFIKNNINSENFPNIETIAFKNLDINNISSTFTFPDERFYLDECTKHNFNKLELIDYNKLKNFDMYYFNKFTCAGNYKKFNIPRKNKDIIWNHLRHSI
tara:strand:+ start:113 stop:538 length:426 start_codon:yes stop_codon:yes gene_type:complete